MGLIYLEHNPKMTSLIDKLLDNDDIENLVAMKYVPNCNFNNVKWINDAVKIGDARYLKSLITKGCKISNDVLKNITLDNLNCVNKILNVESVDLSYLSIEVLENIKLTPQICSYIDSNSRNILWYLDCEKRETALVMGAKFEQFDKDDRSWISDGKNRKTDDPIFTSPHFWTTDEAFAILKSGNTFYVQDVYWRIPEETFLRTNNLTLSTLSMMPHHQARFCEETDKNGMMQIYFRISNGMKLDSEQTDIALKNKEFTAEVAYLSIDKEKVLRLDQSIDTLTSIAKTGYTSDRFFSECVYKGIYLSDVPKDYIFTRFSLSRCDIKTLDLLIMLKYKLPHFDSAYNWHQRDEKVKLLIQYEHIPRDKHALKISSSSIDTFLFALRYIDIDEVKSMDMSDSCERVRNFVKKYSGDK